MSRVMTRTVAIFVIVACGLLGIGTALGQLVDTGSPAQGHAAVIAQGVAAMGDGDLGWRVTRASNPLQGEPAPRDDPGFLLVDTGALLVTDLDTDSQARLAASEAMFLGLDTRHEEAQASGDPVSFYRIDLVDASEVNTAGADELLFVGEPFASPGGNRDVDLVRDVLADGESVSLALEGRDAPVLLLVIAGTLELVPVGNDTAAPVPLPAGQGAALGGDVIATASGGAGATFVTAFVGSEAEPFLAQAAPTATPLPEPATLSVQALACPAAYEGTDYATDCVEPVADLVFDLSSATGVTAQGTTAGDGTVSFVELIPDTYSLTGGVPGEFAEQVAACSVPSEGSQTVQGATFPVAGGDAVTCQWYVIPADLQGETEGVGTVAVTAYLCPGTPLDPAADCAATDIGGAAIAGPEGMPDDLSGGLPFGTYDLQTDGIAVPEGYQLSEVRGSSGASDSGWTFTVDETNPDAALQVIYVPVGQTADDGDEDTDGLTGAQETEIGTDPVNPDSDADGLFDGPEIAAGTDPTLYDSDGDGFGDNQEAANGTDPLDPASVPEGESGIDSDGDLLTDAQEEELGTDATVSDTDGDGLTDFGEVGFEPGSSTGTDPLVFDTDGDGVGDGDELANGTDPLDPASF